MGISLASKFPWNGNQPVYSIAVLGSYLLPKLDGYLDILRVTKVYN